MRITILTVGTRGDVQPCIALGLGLKAAGHDVKLATHAIFEDFIVRHGLEFTPIHANPREILEGEGGQAWMGTGRNPFTMVMHMRSLAAPRVRQFAEETYHACQGADIVLCSTLGFFAGFSILEKLKIPAVGAFLQPVSLTGDFPSILFPPLPGRSPLRSAYNRFTHDLMMEINWQLFRQPINQVRKEILAIPPVQTSFRHMIRQPYPVIYGFSQHVLPRPLDWGTNIAVSGYWFLDDEAWQPPQALLEFLEAGSPPVYIGFGSMANQNAAGAASVVLDALRQSGQRGLLLTGWGGIHAADLPDSVFCVDSAPHDWLFPRMAAVVHHGGAGTTAAGLRAGVPSILVPHFADQPFWAQRVAALGVGPKPVARKKLNARSLAQAILTAVNDESIRQRAVEIGAKIRAEDGIGNAVRAFERIAARLDQYAMPDVTA